MASHLLVLVDLGKYVGIVMSRSVSVSCQASPRRPVDKPCLCSLLTPLCSSLMACNGYRDIPTQDFKDLCALAFTFSAIQQANTDVRTKRPALISMIGTIVNGKREAERKRVINEIRLWRRILEQANARHQSMANIVFLDQSRILQADEFGFSLNGTDEKAGGRPAKFPLANNIGDAGEPALKSSEKCTVMQAVTFADEALPPFVIFPTAAKKDENKKISAKRIATFHQVEGQYGNERRGYYDCSIALSQSGGMTKELFWSWLLEELCDLFPDMEDVPGKHILLKADSGPGKCDRTVIYSLLCTRQARL